MKTVRLISCLLLIITIQAFGEDAPPATATEWESVDNTPEVPSPAPDVAQPTPQLTEKNTESLTSQDLREQYAHNLIANYSFIDTWIPGKYGATYAYNSSSTGSWELEYLRGSISVPFIIEDLGKITDQRLTLMYRSFNQRNSFSFQYGINYSSFKFQLGPDYLATITGSNVSAFDVVSVETLGVTWGLGNRWQINRAILSFDWFMINIPVIVLESEAPFLEASSSEASKSDIRDALDVIEKLPTFAILKFGLGISF